MARPCLKCGHIQLGFTHRQTLNFVRTNGNGSATSREMANSTGKSIQTCSNRLAKLHEFGVLSREAEEEPSGGIIYRYTEAKKS